MPFGGPDRKPQRPIPRYEHPLGPRQPIGLRLLVIGAVVGAAFAAALTFPEHPPKPRQPPAGPAVIGPNR